MQKRPGGRYRYFNGQEFPQGDGKAATSSPQEAVKAATGGEFSSLMDNDAGFAGLSVSFRESIGGRQRDKSRQGGTK